MNNKKNGCKGRNYVLSRIFLNIVVSVSIVVAAVFTLDALLAYSSIKLPRNLTNAISLAFALCVASYYLNFWYPITLDHIGIAKDNRKKLIIWGGVGAIVLLFINSPFRNGINPIIIERYLVDPQEGFITIAIFLLMVVILIPIVEEIFYRGFLFRIIRSNCSKIWSFFIPSLLFSMGHNLSIPAFLSSLVLCYLLDKTKLIGPCIVAHALWNLVWFGVKYYMVWNL